MADNYLERKYEQYQTLKTASASRPLPRVAAKRPPRRVFVTGGAHGIGRSILSAFRAEGDQVAFCDIDRDGGLETARQTGAAFFPLDVTDVQALQSCMNDLFKRWGDLDVVINNVGRSDFRPLTECTVDQFDQTLAVNLRPLFITTQQLALHRTHHPPVRPYGRVINLCSTRYLMSEPHSEAYAASKGAIYSLTHALAVSLSRWNITVNSISPGWIETGDYASLRPEDHLQHPSSRVGKPEDIARLCLFLCHEENDFINGENITVDGGMTKRMHYIE